MTQLVRDGLQLQVGSPIVNAVDPGDTGPVEGAAAGHGHAGEGAGLAVGQECDALVVVVNGDVQFLVGEGGQRGDEGGRLVG